MKTLTKMICLLAFISIAGIAEAGTGTSSVQNDASSVTGVVASSQSNINPGSGSTTAQRGPGENTIQLLPDPVIIGPTTSVCPGQVRSYTCTLVAGATSYDWVVPPACTIMTGQGTNSIDVSFGAGFFQG